MGKKVFFGSDRYSAIVLRILTERGNMVFDCVITDRSKPKGRLQSVEPNPVENYANEHNIKISYYPENIEDQSKLIDLISELSPETAVAASFDHLIPASVIGLFPGGILNVHPSLLPQYRNVSPVQYALALGDEVTGVTIFKLSAGIDNGEIVAQAAATILPADTSTSLSDRLFQLGADLLIAYFAGIPAHPVDSNSPHPLIFTRRLTRDSGFVEWEVLQRILKGIRVESAETANPLLSLRLRLRGSGGILHDLYRALYPWPGVWTLVPAKNGELRVSLELVEPEFMVKIAGKPKAIRWDDFVKYYL